MIGLPSFPLFRTRRLLSRKRTANEPTGAARVATMLSAVPKVEIKKEKVEDGEEDTTSGTVTETPGLIVLDTTAEFCRQIGEEETSDRGEEEMEMA